MRVKDMGRQQQKAVFAHMTDDRYLATLQGAEKYRARRDYLLKKKELSETYEDKIFDIYNNQKLTHRQKMARISQLKKTAASKLNKYQSEHAGSIVGEIRQENLRRFKKDYDIKEVEVNAPKNYKVAIRLPSIGQIKGEWVEGKPMTRMEAANFARSRKKLGWKTRLVKI